MCSPMYPPGNRSRIATATLWSVSRPLSGLFTKHWLVAALARRQSCSTIPSSDEPGLLGRRSANSGPLSRDPRRVPSGARRRTIGSSKIVMPLEWRCPRRGASISDPDMSRLTGKVARGRTGSADAKRTDEQRSRGRTRCLKRPSPSISSASEPSRMPISSPLRMHSASRTSPSSRRTIPSTCRSRRTARLWSSDSIRARSRCAP